METYERDDTGFVLCTQKAGRMKYLLLTLCPPLLLGYVVTQLMKRGVLPAGSAVGLITIVVMCALLLVLEYFLILRKNHTLKVEGSTIREKRMLSSRAQTVVEARQIHSVRRNFLGEWLLKDGNGKTLLCVESNMSDRDLLEEWLGRHGITVE